MCYFRQYLHHVQDSAKEICNCNWLAFWMIHVDPKCLQINVEVTHFHRKWLNPIRCYAWVIPNFKAKVLWCSYVALSARVCIHTLGGRQLRHEQPFTIGPNSHGIRAVCIMAKQQQSFPYRFLWDPNHQDHYIHEACLAFWITIVTNQIDLR